MTWKIAFVLALLLPLSACETPPKKINDANIVEKSHHAAQALINNLQWDMEAGRPLIVASFANIDNLGESSSLGRIVSQQLASQFTQKGYSVIEVLLRRSVYIKQQQGQFLLSRDVQELSREHDAQAVIVGTYAVGADNIYITAKLIRAQDSIVLAAHDYTLPMGPDAQALLKRNRFR